MNESPNDRDPLEQLADEFAARCRRGESPSIAEYAARYPRFAGQIAGLFPAVAMLEQLRIDLDRDHRRRPRRQQRRQRPCPGPDLQHHVVRPRIGRVRQ